MTMPYQMTERDLIARHLRQRADFWDQYPAHKDVARALRNEAHIVSLGRHGITRPPKEARRVIVNQ